MRLDQGVDCTPLRLGILMAYEEDVLDDVGSIMARERLRHRCTSLDEELRTLVVVAFGCELESPSGFFLVVDAWGDPPIRRQRSLVSSS